MRKNEKGSSLIFALVVISILITVVAACMAIAFSYYNRTIVANSDRQAYLTAKSVITNIVDNVVNGEDEYLKLIPSTEGSKNYEVSDDFIKLKMGTIDVLNIKKIEESEDMDKVTITVSATYGDRNKTIKADLQSLKGKNNWKLLKYYENKNIEEKENINVKNAKDLLGVAENLTKKYYENSKNKDKWLISIKFIDDQKTELSDVYKKCELYDKGFFDSAAMYFNDVPLRKLIYYGYYDKKFPVFNKSEVKKDISEEAKEFINKQEYMLIPKYPYSSYDPVIIYADTGFQIEGSGWNQTIQLIYMPEEACWYYLNKDQKIRATYFDNSNGNSKDKWNNFVNDVLHDETKAEKIT
ncbi:MULTISPECIES: hypothetical protein [Bacillota]|uniref:Uncharacterized protein n=2 Tax=Amedibacillus TaxID=2749846 RepID=A0ABS9R8Q9_9FIRM|nr:MULTISPECIES: hypothetical protein [Bacillota]MCH4286053.1 hypothetical protein [Amedibacillus hominis]RGB51341.1 hypothetical protein DW271_15045 [Absiella sp. AM22-9]RGB52209.1 hypothetical protein DW120_20180 [Absiella sp. AM10-20]RHU00504.1 hypothetical protein DW716_19405 [Absiella sp. AM27-20]